MSDLLAGREKSSGLDTLSGHHACDLLLLSLESVGSLLLLKQPLDELLLVEVVEVLAALEVLLLILLFQ